MNYNSVRKEAEEGRAKIKRWRKEKTTELDGCVWSHIIVRKAFGDDHHLHFTGGETGSGKLGNKHTLHCNYLLES